MTIVDCFYKIKRELWFEVRYLKQRYYRIRFAVKGWLRRHCININ